MGLLLPFLWLKGKTHGEKGTSKISISGKVSSIEITRDDEAVVHLMYQDKEVFAARADEFVDAFFSLVGIENNHWQQRGYSSAFGTLNSVLALRRLLMSFQHTPAEAASLIHNFLQEKGNVLSHPLGEQYQVCDAKIDPVNAGLIKVQMLYKREKQVVSTLAYHGPTSQYLLSQIPGAQVGCPDLPMRIYICEEYLGIYTWGNPVVNDIEPVVVKDFQVGRAYIRVLGYTQHVPVAQLCKAARQIDEHGRQERIVLSPMQETELYTEILTAYLTCQRTEKRRVEIEARGKTSLVYSVTSHLNPFLLPATALPYTPYTDLGEVPNGTPVAFLGCACQQCQFHKSRSNAGMYWPQAYSPGGYNWGNLYPSCGTYAANEPGKYCWIWETERVRPASIAYAKGPILASPVPPVLDYETGNFQAGAWISIWKYGEQYIGSLQSVIERYQGTIRYGERSDVQTSPCTTIEQAEAASRVLWHQMEQ